ncbi:MAG: DUF3238 domain-containing protein [Planctomycetales bacterium]|jgi:RHS repeat-associated protein|nr:DUF3238 domain-containing protein [Planctomycetales bacterium]
MPKTTYVWDELSDNVIEEYEDGVLSASYTHEPGLYGNLLSQNRNGVTSYYHYDGRGDTVALTDDSGDVTDTKEYDAWGNVIASTGSTVTPYLFVGRQGYRTGSEGIYVRARLYQPKTMRWSSPDPVVPWISSKQYTYSSGCAVACIDPSGLKEIRLSFAAFIHKRRGKWLDEPGGVRCEFKSDERGFNEPGTSRIASHGQFDSCEIGFQEFGERPIGIFGTNSVGSSHRRCWGVSLTCPFSVFGWNYSELTAPLKEDEVTSRETRCGASVRFLASAAYPFVDVAPRIDYDVTFIVTAEADSIIVLVKGKHDGFPDYEAIVDDKTLYEYFSPYRGPSPSSLGGGPEVPFEKTIRISAPTRCTCGGTCGGL